MKNANVFVDVDLTLVDANGRLLDGAREALEALKRAGCHLFLCSNVGAEYCRKVAEANHLADLFEGFMAKLLSHWRSRDEARRLHDQTALMRFGSLSELLSLRRKSGTSSRRGIQPILAPGRFAALSARRQCGSILGLSGSYSRRSRWRSS